LPGSGKSTLAKEIQASLIKDNGLSLIDTPIYSTDDYFMQNDDDKYIFDSSKLYQAHKWNQKRVNDAMARGVQNVIVDNTNTLAKEAKSYVDMAMRHGYNVVVVETKTAWAKDPFELYKKNTHGVPLETIKKMLARYEPNDVFKKKLGI
jgi:tRNA uridine 5-carbamoylmethylation protein Kti12